MANRRTATLDGVSGKVLLAPARTPPIKLDSLRALRDEMGRVYREARTGKIETQDATRLVFVLDKLRELVIAVDVEARLSALEQEVLR